MPHTPQVVWLARHGNRADFVDETWRQRADRPHDPPLSDGLAQSRALGRRLIGEGIARVIASPFLRTLQTAAQVAEVLDVPILVEAGVCEWLNIEWFDRQPDFLPRRLMKERFPHIDLRYRSMQGPTFPETWAEHEERCARTIEALMERFRDSFLVVGHGASVIGVTRGLLADPGARVHAGLCSVVKLVREAKGWRLEMSGDRSHLDPTEDEFRLG